MKYARGKRIVSKGEYAINVSVKTGLRAIGAFFILSSTIGIICMLILSVFVICKCFEIGSFQIVPAATLTLLIVSLLLFLMMLAGFNVLDNEDRIDVGTPHTRANTADLPAPDSLVRASREPVQAQKAVLLRTITEDHETQAEQLLRATAGN